MHRSLREEVRAAGRPQVWGRLVRRIAMAGFVVAMAACGGRSGGGSDPVEPPTLTTGPQPVTVNDGQAASFSVVASGTALSYQWQRNGSAVAGATSATLTLPAATLADDGARFRVVVGNAGGSVTSGDALLTVRPVAPGVTTPPAALTVTEGQSASFSVLATGSAPLAYQWLRNGTPVSGATAATYTLASAALSDNGAVFSVTVTNAAGSTTSAGAALTVNAQAGNGTGDGTRSLWLADTHTLALRSDGLLMGWGANGNAQLGNGAAIAGSPAVQIASGVASASASFAYGLAVDDTGALLGWGSTSSAWLGGTDTTFTSPQSVGWPVRSVHQAEAGLQPFGTASFTIALLTDGTVWFVPASRSVVNGVVTLGSGQVPGPYDITSLSRGHGAAYAVRRDGSVWHLSFSQSTASGPSWTTGRADLVAGLAGVRDVVCGTNHCLALLADGTLRAWGEGRSGELGHGIAASSATPVTVNGLTDVTHIAATSNFGASLARTRDGRVFSWGSGEMSARPAVRSGAFTFPPADVAVPTEVPALAGSTEVSCSANHCAARRADGSVWTWGNNLYGQLGAGTVAAQEPVQVPGVNLNSLLTGTAGRLFPSLRLLAVPRPAVATVGQSVSFHASAVGRVDGLSFQWLRNGAAIAGATSAAYTTPALAAGDDGARFSVRVSDGTDTLTSAEATLTVQAGTASLWPAATHTLALRRDGVLLGWGSNASRQLGSGSAVAGSAAVQVATGMSRASAAATFGLAVDTTGGLWGWGADRDVWLGGSVPLAGAAPVDAPTAVLWPARRVRQAEAGLQPFSGARNSFVLLADGSVWQLPGDRATSGANVTHTAIQVAGLYDVTSLAQGHGAALAVRRDGNVFRIASEFSTTTARAYATPVDGLAAVRQVVCGSDHCLALQADGTLRAWGQGTRGQLGQGAAVTSTTPVVVSGLSGVTHIAVTSAFGASFARTADGRVYSWGAGESSGRVLAGTSAGVPADALVPTEVPALAGATEVACATAHCVARLADGSVWAWGANGSGQLGVAVPSAQAPVRVTGVSLN